MLRTSILKTIHRYFTPPTMIGIEQLTLAPGSETLLKEVSWDIHPQQKIGLIGRNGSGKSSLIRVLVGEEDPLAGHIKQHPTLKIGYLPQSAVSGSDKSLWDEAREALVELNALRNELEIAELEAQSGIDGADQKLSLLLERWRSLGGYQEDETIGTTLHGLGFSAEDWTKSCSSFSGGWQMRIALAKLLLSKPDLAILDEPTNHLDIHARSWLAKHLSKVKYTVVVVSHDRYFLDKIITHVVELRDQKLHFYKGNYTQFLNLRIERMDLEQKQHDRLVEQRNQLQGFIDRFGAKATKAKQAQSKKKQLDKLQLPSQSSKLTGIPTLHIPPPLGVSSPLIKCHQLNVGWSAKQILIESLNLEIHVGMKLALIGPNGSGKSSLIKTLVGDLTAQSGFVEYGDRLKWGIFQQDIAQELPEDETPLSYLHDQTPSTPEEIRRSLGALGLRSEAHLRTIKTLSGGERSRIALAKIFLEPHNLLLLDEPSNHLDVESATALAAALKAYTGTLILISHDRNLILESSTHLGRFEHKNLTLYSELVPSLLEPEQITPTKQGGSKSNESYADRKKKNNRVAKLKREIAKLEEALSLLEQEQTTTHQQLNQSGLSYDDLQKLLAEDQHTNEQIETLMLSWEKLEEELEQLSHALELL